MSLGGYRGNVHYDYEIVQKNIMKRAVEFLKKFASYCAQISFFLTFLMSAGFYNKLG